MTPSALRDRLLEALELKSLPRAGWVRAGIAAPESVAAHSWGVAWLVLALCPSALDRARALAMAVIHDLPEVRTGDVTPHDGIEAAEKIRLERGAMAQLAVPFARRDELVALWEEYTNGVTREARFVRACDKLDMGLQAALYARDQGIDTHEFVESALTRLTDPQLRTLMDP